MYIVIAVVVIRVVRGVVGGGGVVVRTALAPWPWVGWPTYL